MKNIRKKLISVIITSSFIFVIGCEKLNINNNYYNEDKDFDIKNIYYSIDKDNYKKYSSKVLDFNLGKVNLGKDTPVEVELKGLLGVPNKVKNVPVIFIFSGNENEISKTDRNQKEFYKGFNYLVKALSEAGYLTVSLNTEYFVDSDNENFIVEDDIITQIYKNHLTKLEKAINGYNQGYGINLLNKGDLNQIGFIGQSSTGKIICNIANNISSDDKSIKGLLSVTPSESLPIFNYPDIPTSILVAEHSLDTTTGFRMYEDIERNSSRKNMANLTYLLGGNSDKFNELLNEDDLLEAKNNELSQMTNLDDKDSINTYQEVTNNNVVSKFKLNISNTTSKENSSTNITEDKENNIDIVVDDKESFIENKDAIIDDVSHEDFLISYARQFFDNIFYNNKDNSIYDIKSPLPSVLYSKNILNKSYYPNKEKIYSSGDKNIDVYGDIKYSNLVESSIPDMDTVFNFNEPSMNIDLNLDKIDWRTKNSGISISLSRKKRNLLEAKSISINWALNHESDLNVGNTPKILIGIEDYNSNTQYIKFSSESSLKKIDGKSKKSILDSGNEYSEWSRYTPISETRIPLDYFDKVDLENIKDIKIQFLEENTGSIYLKDIYINK